MVKQGYKQTEIGVIPEDWDVYPLSKISDINPYSDCKTPQEFFYVDLESVVGGTLVNKKLLNKANAPSRAQRHFEYSDILYQTVRPYQKNNLFVDFDAHKYIASTGYAVIRSHKDRIIPQYLYQYIHMDRFVNAVLDNCTGTSYPAINPVTLSNLIIRIPTNIEEQAHIAEALSDVDSMISSLEKLIAKKKAVKQGAMQELLMGKKRLPGFYGEWVEVTMDSYVDFQVGFPFSSAYFNNGSNGLRLIKNRDLKSDDQIYYTSETYASEYVVENGDILVGMDGDFLPCKWHKGKALLNQRVGRLLPKKNLDGLFAYYALQKPLAELQNGTGATTVKHLSHGDIKKLVVPMPPTKEEQIAIASILSDMDNEIESLEQKLAKTRQIKQGMMQQLLTGKIRFTGKDEDIPRKRTLHSANIYFKRAVLAAEIASRLYQESTFGHVKMEKLLFLTEKLCDIDLNSNYHRDAAGPYDNRALRSIDSQLKKQKWFDVVTIDRARRYIPMEKSGTHSEYFKRYYNHILPTFNFIISTFQKMNTEQCEIVATLYSAWEDFLLDGCVPNDSMIVEEVLNNWHNSKKRISQERWESALNWMRQKNIIPKQRCSM